jgi:hypothetical protein
LNKPQTSSNGTDPSSVEQITLQYSTEGLEETVINLSTQDWAQEIVPALSVHRERQSRRQVLEDVRGLIKKAENYAH